MRPELSKFTNSDLIEQRKMIGGINGALTDGLFEELDQLVECACGNLGGQWQTVISIGETTGEIGEQAQKRSVLGFGGAQGQRPILKFDIGAKAALLLQQPVQQLVHRFSLRVGGVSVADRGGGGRLCARGGWRPGARRRRHGVDAQQFVELGARQQPLLEHDVGDLALLGERTLGDA